MDTSKQKVDTQNPKSVLQKHKSGLQKTKSGLQNAKSGVEPPPKVNKQKEAYPSFEKYTSLYI